MTHPCPDCDGVPVSEISEISFPYLAEDGRTVELRATVELWSCTTPGCGLQWKTGDAEKILDAEVRKYEAAHPRMRAPFFAPSHLIQFRACGLKKRLAACEAAGWSLHVGRPLREWAEQSLTGTPDLAWAMWHLDQRRCLRALASVVEAVLSADADPRSRAILPMLREPERYDARAWETAERAAEKVTKMAARKVDASDRAQWDNEWEAGQKAWYMAWTAARAAGVARAMHAVRKKWEARGAARAADVISNAMRVCPKSDIRRILLQTWEQPSREEG